MEEPTGRVTINMLYAKQLENEKLLIELSERLANMEHIPSRVRELELNQAKQVWIEKVAYAALLAGITAVVGGLISIL
jgi:(p)ppGpp synthase/HD superfamily hydrolase